MDLIQRVIEYIDENIIDMEFPEHRLHEKFGVSDSKLQKDFRNAQSITLRQFLINRKMSLAQDMMFDHPLLTRQEIMVRINYNLTERSFRNHFREFEDSYKGLGFGVNHFRNESAFAEIYLRLIMFLDLVELDPKELIANSTTIKHDVKNTIFTIGVPLLIDDCHCYQPFLNPVSMEVDYMFFPAFGDTACSHHTIGPHLVYLNKLERNLGKHLPFSLTEAVEDFHKYPNNITYLDAEELLFPGKLEIEGDPLININRDAAFIKQTDHLIEDLKAMLKENSEKCLIKYYGIKLNDLKNFINAVTEDDVVAMRRLLGKEQLSNIYTLSLLLDLASNPFFEGDILHESRLFFDESVLKNIAKLPNTSRVDLIIQFYRKMKEVEENEEWDEPDREEILYELFYS